MQYLRKRGYRILGRNIRTRSGEIDILACKAGEVMVVEVKTRRHVETSLGHLYESVCARKLARVHKAAEEHFMEAFGGMDFPWQIDVAFVLIPPYSAVASVHYLENALSFEHLDEA